MSVSNNEYISKSQIGVTNKKCFRVVVHLVYVFSLIEFNSMEGLPADQADLGASVGLRRGPPE